jgi:hypothetical protein
MVSKELTGNECVHLIRKLTNEEKTELAKKTLSKEQLETISDSDQDDIKELARYEPMPAPSEATPKQATDAASDMEATTATSSEDCLAACDCKNMNSPALGTEVPCAKCLPTVPPTAPYSANYAKAREKYCTDTLQGAANKKR